MAKATRRAFRLMGGGLFFSKTHQTALRAVFFRASTQHTNLPKKRLKTPFRCLGESARGTHPSSTAKPAAGAGVAGERPRTRARGRVGQGPSPLHLHDSAGADRARAPSMGAPGGQAGGLGLFPAPPWGGLDFPLLGGALLFHRRGPSLFKIKDLLFRWSWVTSIPPEHWSPMTSV
jgi:hypothetical protein